MKASRIGSFLMVLITLLSLVQVSAHPSVTRAATAPSLVMDLLYTPVTMDPQVDYDLADATVLGNVYDGLVRAVGSKTVKIVGDLATSWKQSPDGKTWTFTLRSGVTFHDGSPVNAAAVKFTFQRLITLNKGAVGDYSEISSVDAPNATTVVFHLAYPFSAFLNSLTTLWGNGIVSPKTVMAHQVKGDLAAKWLFDHDAGSGPWTIKQWVQNQKIVLEPYAGYWKGWSGNHIGQVILQWPSASSTQRLAIQRGDADIATNMTAQDYDAVAKVPGISVPEYTAQTIEELRLNTSKGPLKNKLVRQALAYTLDYDTFVKAVYRGHGARMLGQGPTGLPNYIPAAHPWTYDLTKAKSLLAQAGYINGFNMQVTWQAGDFFAPLMAQIWQADVAPLGIKLMLQQLTPAQYNSESLKASTMPDSFFGQWTMDYADDQQMYWIYFSSTSNPSSGNVFFFDDSLWQKTLAAAVSATSPREATTLYTKALDVIYTNALDIPLVQANESTAIRNNVHGWVYNFLYSHEYVDLYAISKS